MKFNCRPASADIWYIHWIFTYQKKQKNKKLKTKKTKTQCQKKFDVNTTVPRRVRWDFQGVLDDRLFLYLEFDMNKYSKNWGNYEVLRIKLGGFIIYCYHFFYLWKLPCAAMFLFAILEFRCIECFAYALVSLVFNIFLCLNTYPSFLVSHSFSSVLLSRNCYVCLVPPHLQGPVIVRVVFVYPSFADPACSPSLPQSGSDDTYFYR